MRPLPGDLRREVQRRTVAQLLLLGWSVERIARKMHCTGRAVRWAIDKPDFQRLFDAMSQEHFQRIDRKLGSLLHTACDALEKMLRHSDWQARDAALDHLFRIHGRYVDRLDVAGEIRHVKGELVSGEMTEEMRQKARELLQLQRQASTKSLPARFTTHDDDERDRDPSGRYMTNGHRDEQDT